MNTFVVFVTNQESKKSSPQCCLCVYMCNNRLPNISLSSIARFSHHFMLCMYLIVDGSGATVVDPIGTATVVDPPPPGTGCARN